MLETTELLQTGAMDTKCSNILAGSSTSVWNTVDGAGGSQTVRAIVLGISGVKLQPGVQQTDGPPPDRETLSHGDIGTQGSGEMVTFV